MIDAGMNMARLSLAHGPVEDTLERVRRVRTAAAEAKRMVGVLIDLPGPKIRTAEFEREMYLNEDDSVEIVTAGKGATSDWQRIAVDHPDLVFHLQAGDRGVLKAFRESNGEFLWQHTHAKLESGRANDWPFQGVASSPLIEGVKLAPVA